MCFDLCDIPAHFMSNLLTVLQLTTRTAAEHLGAGVTEIPLDIFVMEMKQIWPSAVLVPLAASRGKLLEYTAKK